MHGERRRRQHGDERGLLKRDHVDAAVQLVRDEMGKVDPKAQAAQPKYLPFRSGDIRHSLADISRATRLLGYQPTHEVGDGLREASRWYGENLR